MAEVSQALMFSAMFLLWMSIPKDDDEPPTGSDPVVPR